jgi:hypothetical protein
VAALSGRPLLVLGMHRSGTSSFVGVAARLGAALGSDLLEANEWNPRGYGEHRQVVAIHDRFLASQGLRWDSARQPAQFGGAAAREAREALRALLLREFADAPLFAVKDPRLCRLLPLWQPLLEELGAAPAYAIVLRHPLEIAASLARRDGLESARSHLLWLEHALPAERETRSAARSFLRYDELFGDWRAVAKRVAAECGLRWPRDPEAAAADVESFLSGDLRHHRAAPAWPDGEAGRFPWVVALHAELLALAERGTSPGRCAVVDRIAERAASARHLYEAELAALEARASALEAARVEAEAAGREAEKRARRAERKRDELAASPALWLRTFVRRRLRGGGAPGA